MFYHKKRRSPLNRKPKRSRKNRLFRFGLATTAVVGLIGVAAKKQDNGG